MTPREMYCETTFTPISPVMQDSLTTSASGVDSLTSLPSTPAKEVEAKLKAARASAQEAAVLCLVIEVFLLFSWLVWVCQVLARRGSSKGSARRRGFS